MNFNLSRILTENIVWIAPFLRREDIFIALSNSVYLEKDSFDLLLRVKRVRAIRSKGFPITHDEISYEMKYIRDRFLSRLQVFYQSIAEILRDLVCI